MYCVRLHGFPSLLADTALCVCVCVYDTQARDGTMAIEDMDGGTFTISNGGVFGSLLGTPIINPPQSAILGMHATVERPVAIQGKVGLSHTDSLSLPPSFSPHTHTQTHTLCRSKCGR